MENSEAVVAAGIRLLCVFGGCGESLLENFSLAREAREA